MNEIEIYKTGDGKTEVEVRSDKDTVWLNRHQISLLFDRDIKTIGKRVSNVFREKELNKKSVVANFATTAKDGKTYKVEHYNLDVVISVGYRVKSKRGHTIPSMGYPTAERSSGKRLCRQSKTTGAITTDHPLMSKNGESENLHPDEAKGLLEIIGNYTDSFVLLSQYDSHSLTADKLAKNITYEINSELLTFS